jgi:hypothetical protein
MASGFSAQTGGQRHKTKVKLRRFAVISAISLPQRGSKSANALKGERIKGAWPFFVSF